MLSEVQFAHHCVAVRRLSSVLVLSFRVGVCSLVYSCRFQGFVISRVLSVPFSVLHVGGGPAFLLSFYFHFHVQNQNLH